MVDNSLKKNISIEWEDFVWAYPNWKKYELSLSPQLWYNGYDGMKTGIKISSDYMNYHHKFDGDFWLNTGFGQIEENLPEETIVYIDENEEIHQETIKTRSGYDRISYDLNYQNPLNQINKGLSIMLSHRKLDGLKLNQIRLIQKSNDHNNELYVELKTLIRQESESNTYLLFEGEDFWKTDAQNNTLSIGIKHKYQYVAGEGVLNFSLRSSTIGSDYQFAQLSFEAINKSKIDKLMINTRMFFQHASGISIAPESKLFAAGANPEQYMENKYTRSTGFVSRESIHFSEQLNHFQMGGGLNLRAYAGYLMPEGDYESQDFSFSGTTGIAFSTEIEFNDYLPFRSKLDLKTYLFTDAGIINTNTLNQALSFGNLRADAGIGATITLFKRIDNISPLTLRIDLPWFMNRPPFGEDYFSTKRFVFGLNRTF
jgi:aminopeptidase N